MRSIGFEFSRSVHSCPMHLVQVWLTSASSPLLPMLSQYTMSVVMNMVVLHGLHLRSNSRAPESIYEDFVTLQPEPRLSRYPAIDHNSRVPCCTRGRNASRGCLFWPMRCCRAQLVNFFGVRLSAHVKRVVVKDEGRALLDLIVDFRLPDCFSRLPNG
jgi:hypothetical protein